MSYRELEPVSPLRPLVDCIWTRVSSPGPGGSSRHLVLPDGCADIIVDTASGRVFVVGPMTVAQTVEVARATTLVAVRFRPGGARDVLAVPLSELTDRRVDLEDVCTRDEDATARLLDAAGRGGPSETIVALQRWIARRARSSPEGDERWRSAVRFLTSASSPRVGEVSAAVGASRQHLARRCRELVGYGPKLLSRVSRLQRLLALVDGERRSGGWAGVAIDAGYADQAHMIREVRALTGRTPRRLRPDFGPDGRFHSFNRGGRSGA